jgi:hypothetical protein
MYRTRRCFACLYALFEWGLTLKEIGGKDTANVLQVDELRKAKRKRNASREEIGRERATMLQIKD